MIAFGEVTSKGVDVDIAADLTDDWVLTLTYAFNDTKVTKSTTATNGNITNVVAGGRFCQRAEEQVRLLDALPDPEHRARLRAGR